MPDQGNTIMEFHTGDSFEPLFLALAKDSTWIFAEYDRRRRLSQQVGSEAIPGAAKPILGCCSPGGVE